MRPKRAPGLDNTDRVILAAALLQGNTAKQVAFSLHYSVEGIRARLRNIRQFYGVTRTEQAVAKFEEELAAATPEVKS